MRCGSRCEKSCGPIGRIVPPFFAPGISGAGPVESSSVPMPTDANLPVPATSPPPDVPPPPPPLLHADRTIEPPAATEVAMTKFLRERDMGCPA